MTLVQPQARAADEVDPLYVEVGYGSLGRLHPTACGPANCDEPLGPCEEEIPGCDPTLACAQVLTCVEGQVYPTACGPANCDEPLGPCADE